MDSGDYILQKQLCRAYFQAFIFQDLGFIRVAQQKCSGPISRGLGVGASQTPRNVWASNLVDILASIADMNKKQIKYTKTGNDEGVMRTSLRYVLTFVIDIGTLLIFS